MIALIDSGFGAINVLNECLKRFNEDFVCLIDNKYAPYGNKKKEFLKANFYKNVNFLIENYNIDLIVIACNTLSSLLSQKEIDELPIKTIKTNPPLEQLKNNDLNKKILIFATKNTIKNNIYVKYYLKKYKNIKYLYIKNLPKLIDININNLTNIKPILNKYLMNKRYKNTKIVILGCTHFTLIANQLKSCLGNIEFYDCVESISEYIELLIKPKEKSTVKFVLTKPDKAMLSNIKKTINNNVSFV